MKSKMTKFSSRSNLHLLRTWFLPLDNGQLDPTRKPLHLYKNQKCWKALSWGFHKWRKRLFLNKTILNKTILCIFIKLLWSYRVFISNYFFPFSEPTWKSVGSQQRDFLSWKFLEKKNFSFFILVLKIRRKTRKTTLQLMI